MNKRLDEIVVFANKQAFAKRLEDLRRKLVRAAMFESAGENEAQLRRIIRQVAEFGDTALAELTEQFDNVALKPNQFRISTDEMKKAASEVDPQLLSSLLRAADNVKKYQNEIFIANRFDLNSHPGIRYLPIKKIGICVPGASAPLPSTVIMTAVPAMVAGVKEITVVSPPRYNNTIHPVILAVCFELGIRTVYRIGGAQAVAALAYGTDTVAKVDKIVGPGSRWVQMAKKEVFGVVDVDSIAGPSEVVIIADKTAHPDWVAADMLSQAEHDPGSAVLLTDSKRLAKDVLTELKNQLKKLARAEQTETSLLEFSSIVVLDNLDKAIETANDFAPEHLEIQCGHKSDKTAQKIENAGAVFIGDYTPVAVGDYWAGPSHTLPTGTTARFFSALTANDFIKSTSITRYDQKQLSENADHIIRLAQAEGLDAHARSVQIRQQHNG